jgi:hypothetical protein
MSATRIGLTSLFVNETSWEQNKEGLITYTEKSSASRSNTNVATPNLNDLRVVGGINCRAVSVNVVCQGGAFTEYTVTYQGGQDTTLQQDTSNSTGEEPIQSHKNFLTDIVPAAGSANVVYNDDNSFRAFNKSSQNNFFGVTAYLNPNMTYKRSFNTTVTATATNLFAVGRIVDPSGDFPDVQDGSTWLCVGAQYTKRGSSFDVSHDFRASGENGWNEYIYGPPVSPPPTP